MNLAGMAVLLPAAGHDLLTARPPHQPGQFAHAELPASRPGLRSGHAVIIAAVTACAPQYFWRAPENTIALSWTTTYHRYMTTWRTPKRAGYLNPISQLEAALIGGVVAV